jgi:hypothetical protein
LGLSFGRKRTGMADGKLGETIRRVTLKLQREYAAEIERDPGGFKRRAVSCFRRLLSPRPGRPRDEAITWAVEMRSRGRPWREVYLSCVPNFASMDSDARFRACLRLRDGVAKRQKAARRRKSPRNLSAR